MNAESTEKLDEMALNSANFRDEIVYRGFVQEQAPDDEYEFDERWVQISPLGTWYGSSTTGEPIREELTPEALESLVQDFHANSRQVPLDRDHNSAKAPLERDTEAYAWVEDLRLMSGGAEAFNGLYAKFKWRKEGVDLVKSRAYRFLSPVFQLDGENRPRRLVSVALTNFPAFDTMPPVYNTTAEPTSEKETDMENDDMDIETLKEEIVNACMERMKAQEKAAEVENTDAEKTEEAKPETEEDADGKPEAGAGGGDDDMPEAASQEEAEDVPEQKDAEPVEEKEEVIKLESLNSSSEAVPAIGEMAKAGDEWRSLHGDDLLAWCRRHPGQF